MFGGRIRGAAGQVQLDENYRVPQFRAKTSLTYANRSGSVGGLRALFRVNCGPHLPLIAVRSTTGPVALVAIELVSGNYEAVFMTQEDAAIAFDVYRFDLSRTLADAGGFGLRVRHPTTGELAYFSQWPVMKPVPPIVAVPQQDPSAADALIGTEPSGRIYAGAQITRFQGSVLNEGVLERYTSGLVVRDGALRVESFATVVRNVGGSGYSFTSKPGTYLPIDVTGVS